MRGLLRTLVITSLALIVTPALAAEKLRVTRQAMSNLLMREPLQVVQRDGISVLFGKLGEFLIEGLTFERLADATEQGIQRVCKHQDLVLGFLAHTGLTLDP